MEAFHHLVNKLLSYEEENVLLTKKNNFGLELHIVLLDVQLLLPFQYSILSHVLHQTPRSFPTLICVTLSTERTHTEAVALFKTLPTTQKKAEAVKVQFLE